MPLALLALAISEFSNVGGAVFCPVPVGGECPSPECDTPAPHLPGTRRVRPREADLIMTRYDLIVNTITEVLPDITELQTGVKQGLGHPVSTGLLETAAGRRRWKPT